MIILPESIQLPVWKRAIAHGKERNVEYTTTGGGNTRTTSTMRYVVHGSQDYAVNVTIEWTDEAPIVDATCSCIAGVNQKPCYHVARVLAGEHELRKILGIDAKQFTRIVLGH